MHRLIHGALALALLALLAPVILLLALLVRFSSPGPVLFRQQRVGRNGRPFRIYKFRTMQVNKGGPEVTGGADPRITPIGAWLRYWKLDELPQLLNVVKGEMALVGPRPEVPRYVAHYTPEQCQTLSVEPGITGLAQLHYRNEEELLRDAADPEALYLKEIMPAKLAIDLDYLRQRSAWTDLCLMVRTFTHLLDRWPLTAARATGAGSRRSRSLPGLPVARSGPQCPPSLPSTTAPAHPGEKGPR